MAAKRGLGKGLNALISEGSELLQEKPAGENDRNGVVMVDIYQVEPDRAQPRKCFDEERIQELAESIRQHGVLQPLLVQKCESYYKIIAGERRWRAAKIAGLKAIPVLIKDYSSAEVFEISLIENIQREDLNPLEEAQAYQRLLQEYGLTQEEVAAHVGKSRPGIANSLRLLNLSEGARDLVASGQLSAGHAKVLLGVTDAKKQEELAARVCREDLSVRQLEKLLKQEKSADKKEDKTPDKAWLYESIGTQIRDILGTKVHIIPGEKKSKIEIEYYSDEDLERLLDLFRSLKDQEEK